MLGGQSITTFIFKIRLFSHFRAIPGIELEAQFGHWEVSKIGMILAAISLATSPAATIAVINETAKGEVTDTTLATVVLVMSSWSLSFHYGATAVSLLGTKQPPLVNWQKS